MFPPEQRAAPSRTSRNGADRGEQLLWPARREQEAGLFRFDASQTNSEQMRLCTKRKLSALWGHGWRKGGTEQCPSGDRRSQPLVLASGTFSRTRAFAQVIMRRILRRDYPGFRGGPKSSDWCPLRMRRQRPETYRGTLCADRHRDQVMLPQARNAQSTRSGERRTWRLRRQADFKGQEAHFCCFHPSGVWDFVPAAPGHCVST